MFATIWWESRGLLTKWEGADEKVKDDFEKNHSHLVTRAVRLEHEYIIWSIMFNSFLANWSGPIWEISVVLHLTRKMESLPDNHDVEEGDKPYNSIFLSFFS